MGILSDIFSKIFPPSHPAVAGAGAAASSSPAGSANVAASSNATVAQAVTPVSEVDVEVILTQRAKQNNEKLNWRTSIVDLMKLLGLDSSLTARKQLAQELKYTGDPNDSASMNIWLQKQVMSKLAANGGKVPADLQS